MHKLLQTISLSIIAVLLTCLSFPLKAQDRSPQASVGIKSTVTNPQVLIKHNERLSEWLLKDQSNLNPSSATSNTPYYLGTSWLSSDERKTQELDKQKLLAAFAKINFPANDRSAQRAKNAFSKLIENLQATGRVALTNTNARYLEVNPKLDPVLQAGERIIIPDTPSTVTVIRSNGSLCKIRYRPNVETRFYVTGCKASVQDDERGADWAWVAQPDGTVHQIPLASWNSVKQVLPAPGSWIWAPPRWSIWTNSAGRVFTTQFAKLLAAQGPSGLENGLDAQLGSSRGLLPNANPKELYRVSRNMPISANLWGETGLMQTPSARTAPAGTGSITLGIFQPYGIVSLFFSPLDWVEFGVRYTNINNRLYGPQSFSGEQTYKDKSTGLKVRVIEENAYVPQLAVGVRDLLGTGLFAGEYIVASKRYYEFDFSAGMGWGQLGTRNNITNPFVTAFGQNFATRSGAEVGQGGTANQKYFHGTAALFGGVQYHTPIQNLVIKAEIDGNNYQQLPFSNTIPVKSMFNFGATYQMKNADFTVGLLGNQQVMFTLTLHERFDLLNTPKLAEAKAIPVSLKPVGSYNPSNPKLTSISQTQSKTTTAREGTQQGTQPNNPPSIVTANELSRSNLFKASATTHNQELVLSNPTNSTKLAKQNITTLYNSTLLEFQRQTQWQVKGLQGTEKVWTVHLLNASGVFLRSRINRGVAVLHRDAPSQVETFRIQFYNWGMLVSEFEVDRKQWMLSETQLLRPSQIRPAITVFDTATLPAAGGNPFFRAPRSNSNNTASTSSVGAPQEERGYFEDQLNHKPYKTNLGISYAQIVGSPDAPFLFALGIKADGLYRFRENTWITGTVNARLIDNFGKYVIDPAPTGLQPVRTDIRSYVTQSIATMPNLQVTNTGKVGDNHFVSAYAGYLEMMFAGAGGEYLWRPANSKVAIGTDLNYVKQRQFNVWTSLQSYGVTTGHLTGYWDTGVEDILVKLSYGKYLAGDVGGTLDLSRVFKNGVKIGAYATRTNVNSVQFGEGSFDKGVYLSIPFDAFFARHSDSSANLLFTPLIRDGGAMLIRKYRLYDMTRTRDERALTAGSD